jgi:malonyl-CoA O-methyltransferase
MDYDRTQIPAVYDRGRDHGPEFLALWMNALESYPGGGTITTILDLGCGTGRFSEALAARFDADVIGIDPSLKMLEQAQRKRRDRRVHYQRARAEAIPLSSQSVDMVFMSMSFHHFNDAGLAALECRRVLREAGYVFVRTGTRDQLSAYPYVPFFPSSHPILENVLPDRDHVRDVFETAGFHTVAAEIIQQTIAPTLAAYADKLSTGADSVLARLSARDFEDGLAAMRSHAATGSDEPVVEPIDLLVFR